MAGGDREHKMYIKKIIRDQMELKLNTYHKLSKCLTKQIGPNRAVKIIASDVAISSWLTGCPGLSDSLA